MHAHTKIIKRAFTDNDRYFPIPFLLRVVPLGSDFSDTVVCGTDSTTRHWASQSRNCIADFCTGKKIGADCLEHDNVCCRRLSQHLSNHLCKLNG